MSAPISAMMSWAQIVPTPSISSSCRPAADTVRPASRSWRERLDLGGVMVDGDQHHRQHSGVLIGEKGAFQRSSSLRILPRIVPRASCASALGRAARRRAR